MNLISTTLTKGWQGKVEVSDREFEFELSIISDHAVELSVSLEPLTDLEDSYFIHLNLDSPQESKFYIENLEISWLEPAVDMHGLYFGGDPREELSRLPFWRFHKDVAAQRGLPFLSFMHRTGENRAAYGLLDQLTETHLQANLSEITRCSHMLIQKPASKDTNLQKIPVEGAWQESFFISYSRESWDSVLSHYAQKVTAAMKQTLLPVPDAAYDPVFCTWTAIHHDVSHDWIMENAPLAADLGFKTWLTDDGWFLDEGKFGDYEKVGEWLPNKTKFPDFRQHVADVKALGFRYLLWVSPFMIGINSQEAKDYAHLLTDGQERERFKNLSPWHPEVADIVKTLLKRLVFDYQLDGLKIDFIDAIAINSERVEGASEQSLGASVYKILDESIKDLLKLEPELLIEFRNAYTNLASRSYANLYRSSDIPFNFALNRWQAVMMRLLVPDRAVHMDPILWHPEDTDENVALHLISGIASVPMISIELADYPKNHIEMIRYWIGFYNEHRDTIIHGEFKPELQPTQIPLIDFVGQEEVITGLYDTARVHHFDQQATHWVLNASPEAFVEFYEASAKACEVIFRDKYGVVKTKQSYTTLPTRLDVEIGGSLEIILA